MNVDEKINRRRRQVLVHAFLFHKLGSPIITNGQFNKFVRELLRLQKKHPDIASNCIYADEFSRLGEPEIRLPIEEPWVENTAKTLLGNHKKWYIK